MSASLTDFSPKQLRWVELHTHGANQRREEDNKGRRWKGPIADGGIRRGVFVKENVEEIYQLPGEK